MSEPVLVKLKMKNTYKSGLSLVGFLIIIVVAIGILYLFYDKVLDPDEYIEVNGVLSINYVDGKKFDVTGSKLIKFSVSNESESISYYYVSFNDIKGDGTYKIKYNDTVLMEGELNATDKIITDYISLDARETKSYTLEISSDNFVQGNISVVMQNGTVVTFTDTILKNTPASKDSLTKVGSEVAIDDEGLIKTFDDVGISYYYRGNVKNNYVSFGDMLWRIVRINGDGTVRLVLNDINELVTKYYTDTNKAFDFDNSNMNEYLNIWLNENLKDELKYISNNKFCSDITKDNQNNYLAYTRIMTNKIPTLNCLGETVSSSIGLLTIDEVILAGAAPNLNNTNYYLYTNDEWFTMSGAKGTENSINMFMISTNGNIRTDIDGNLYRKVRPVINLIKNIEVSGTGTKEDPYVIVK